MWDISIIRTSEHNSQTSWLNKVSPKKVREIIRPFRASIPLNPCVVADDKITRAIKLMLDNEVKRIAVVRNNRPIGFILLEDAFEAVGLPEY